MYDFFNLNPPILSVIVPNPAFFQWILAKGTSSFVNSLVTVPIIYFSCAFKVAQEKIKIRNTIIFTLII